jgi:hypothetical protein
MLLTASHSLKYLTTGTPTSPPLPPSDPNDDDDDNPDDTWPWIRTPDFDDTPPDPEHKYLLTCLVRYGLCTQPTPDR